MLSFSLISPIAVISAYVAMVRRFRLETPDNPLVLGASWNVLLGSGRMTAVQLAYFSCYGFDDNVMLTILGMIGLIPGFYFAFESLVLLDHMTKSWGML